ncbi:RNA-binding S4 domain-containing protein [Sneathiella marina]|uniref:RNA-binding S4 domain-containing protein n=1 Tax=Sneathiella marina TaxID=2950108 RepID=A0ABY4W7I6_9PROT|nr:RNA-binding S4 domain-containing protein [Sneathiella marina]USG62093.1 RNA-binding S4 domain-containing protein [Sneathiella marina]
MSSDRAEPSAPTLRVDKWLWFARFFKSRNIATKLVQARKLRINSVPVAKASVTVKAGDVLTFQQQKSIRVIRIVDIGTRRGPASEAQSLYEDLAPLETKKPEPDKTRTSGQREPGAGRPTKADRRALDKLRPDPEDP